MGEMVSGGVSEGPPISSHSRIDVPPSPCTCPLMEGRQVGGCPEKGGDPSGI